MVTYDPGRLVLALRGIQDELERWVMVSSDALREAQRHHRYTTERVHQSQHGAAQLDHQATVDATLTAEEVHTCRRLAADCAGTCERTQRLIENTGRVMVSAESTLSHWMFEVEVAQSWLERAHERLEIARMELERAVSELDDAHSTLASAEGALQEGQSYRDEDGGERDCSGLESAVEAAREYVRICAAHVQVCRAEFDAAEREVAAAEDSVACSRRGVHEATQAVELATMAKDRATEALEQAHWSGDHSQAALKLAHTAVSTAVRERQIVGLVKGTVQRGTTLAEQAGLAQRRAADSGDTGQRDALGAVRELERRMASLRRLDMPTL